MTLFSTVQKIEHFLNSQAAIEALLPESWNEHYAKTFLKKLRASLPQSQPEWEKALSSAQVDAKEKWIFVLPTNHSVAGLYPLTFAALSGVDVLVRWPKLKSDLFLRAWCNLLPQGKIIIDTASPDIAHMPIQELAVLLYGSDETVAAFQHVGVRKLKAFASEATVGICPSENLKKCKNEILEDALELNQTGCKSLRGLITYGEVPAHADFPLVESSTRLSSHGKTLRHLSLQRRGVQSLTSWENDWCLAHFSVEQFQIAPFPFVLSCCHVATKEDALHLASHHATRILDKFGTAQIVPWNGEDLFT